MSARSSLAAGVTELPIDVWANIAQRLASVFDLWALTAASRQLHSLRSSPALVAWRRRRVDLVKAVHECNVRACEINTWRNFDIDPAADYYIPPPPNGFLEACPAYAWANAHQAMVARPSLAALMGRERCAALRTQEDRQAVATLRQLRFAMWGDFLNGCGALSPTDSVGSWVVWAVDGLEAAMKLVSEHGLSLDSDVPPHLDANDDAEFTEHVKELGYEDMQTLREWLEDHEEEFGPAFVEAVLQRFD